MHKIEKRYKKNGEAIYKGGIHVKMFQNPLSMKASVVKRKADIKKFPSKHISTSLNWTFLLKKYKLYNYIGKGGFKQGYISAI